MSFEKRENPQGTAGEQGQLAAIGEACFSFLVSHPETLSHFMQTTGMGANELREKLDSAELRDGMLDYFVTNEPALLAMCANANLSAEQVTRLWQRRNPGHG